MILCKLLEFIDKSHTTNPTTLNPIQPDFEKMTRIEEREGNLLSVSLKI